MTKKIAIGVGVAVVALALLSGVGDTESPPTTAVFDALKENPVTTTVAPTTAPASTFMLDVSVLAFEGADIADQAMADIDNQSISWEETGALLAAHGADMLAIADEMRSLPATGEEVRIRDMSVIAFEMYAEAYTIIGVGLITDDPDRVDEGVELLLRGTQLVDEVTGLIESGYGRSAP